MLAKAVGKQDTGSFGHHEQRNRCGRLGQYFGRAWGMHGTKYLNLSKNKIGDEGVVVLASVLREFQALSHLDLGENSIGQEGAGRLAQVLGECRALSHLDFRLNGIGSCRAKTLVKVLE